ncbi:hypothetical protein [Kitasatospora brasiliensis]|uniref:hypothetical protein n=1 Tax=Kitasatospora brasiliensis TaxID=3058040 RepID=UPI002931E530|nr:hypothetical protein [Kitasatospora sp. K002]
MSEPEKFEDDLLYALTRTGEGFRTERADLVAGGYRLGRRRWRRRSAAAVVSGAAALALVGTGAVYLTSVGGKDAGTVRAASAPAAGAASGVAAAATPTSVKSAAPAVVSGDEVLATFRALLPKGEITEATGRGTDSEEPDGFASASLVLDDGQGKSLIQLGVQKDHPKQAQQQLQCPSDLKASRIDACTLTALPDGSKLLLQQGHEYSDSRADTKEWFAILTGPDGRSISVHEWNAAKEKGAPDSRPNPPLTLDQLKAVVTDKSWDRIVAAIKYNGVDEAAVDPGLSLPDREAVLAGLLPQGVTVTGRHGDPLTADFDLAQGQASSVLEVKVENWAHGGNPMGERAFKDATTLPDGSRILVNDAPAGTSKPYAVNVLRKDGLAVLVYQLPGSQPLLTSEQLKAIATSPAWKAKK